LVETKSAPARDAHAHATHPHDALAAELIEWIARFTPDFALMSQPFTQGELRQVVASYPLNDIKRILGVAWSKGAHKIHLSAYTAFRNYADRDHILLEQAGRKEDSGKLFTYEQMCDYIHRHGGEQAQLFVPVPQPHGRPMWRRRVGIA
jgi:hypothetical protein